MNEYTGLYIMALFWCVFSIIAATTSGYFGILIFFNAVALIFALMSYFAHMEHIEELLLKLQEIRSKKSGVLTKEDIGE